MKGCEQTTWTGEAVMRVYFFFFLCRSNQECIPGCIANEFRADRLYFEAEAYRPLIGLLFCLVSIK